MKESENLRAIIFTRLQDRKYELVFFFKSPIKGLTSEEITSNIEIKSLKSNVLKFIINSTQIDQTLIKSQIKLIGPHPTIDCELEIKNITIFRGLSDQPLSNINDAEINLREKISFSLRLQLPIIQKIDDEQKYEEQKNTFILGTTVRVAINTGPTI